VQKIRRIIHFGDVIYGLIVNDSDRKLCPLLKVAIKPIRINSDQSLTVEILSHIDPIAKGIWPQVRVHNQLLPKTLTFGLCA